MATIIAWISAHGAALVPWCGWILSELMALIPSLKSSGVIDFILRVIGYTGQTPTLPAPPTTPPAA